MPQSTNANLDEFGFSLVQRDIEYLYLKLQELFDQVSGQPAPGDLQLGGGQGVSQLVPQDAFGGQQASAASAAAAAWAYGDGVMTYGTDPYFKWTNRFIANGFTLGGLSGGTNNGLVCSTPGLYRVSATLFASFGFTVGFNSYFRLSPSVQLYHNEVSKATGLTEQIIENPTGVNQTFSNYYMTWSVEMLLYLKAGDSISVSAASNATSTGLQAYIAANLITQDPTVTAGGSITNVP